MLLQNLFYTLYFLIQFHDYILLLLSLLCYHLTRVCYAEYCVADVKERDEGLGGTV